MKDALLEKVLFFGYGGNRSRSKIKEAIGRDPGDGLGAILKGYTLNVQGLSQIPKEVQSFLQKVYGNDFKTYTIRKGAGQVLGVIWKFTPEDLEKMKQWEFVGPYREIIEVELTTSTEQIVKAYTEKSLDSFPITFVVDGLIYDVFAFTKQKASDPNTQAYYTQKRLVAIRQWFANHTARTVKK